MSVIVYDKNQPTHVIVSCYDKGSFRTTWLDWDFYQKYKPEADKLIEEYWNGGRFGKRSFVFDVYDKHIGNGLASIINDNVVGLKCEVEFHLETGQCSFLHITR